jgi:hypothetical protein
MGGALGKYFVLGLAFRYKAAVKANILTLEFQRHSELTGP